MPTCSSELQAEESQEPTPCKRAEKAPEVFILLAVIQQEGEEKTIFKLQTSLGSKPSPYPETSFILYSYESFWLHLTLAFCQERLTVSGKLIQARTQIIQILDNSKIISK